MNRKGAEGGVYLLCQIAAISVRFAFWGAGRVSATPREVIEITEVRALFRKTCLST